MYSKYKCILTCPHIYSYGAFKNGHKKTIHDFCQSYKKSIYKNKYSSMLV